MARRIEAGRRHAARGFALVMVLVAVAVLSLATLVPLRNEQQAMQRERERELLFIGEQFRQAIASYAAASPGGVTQFPKALADLLEDKRFPFAKRHLRRLYVDPMTGAADWALIKEQGAIVGVASSSARVPLKRNGFALSDQEFAAAATYADWKFIRPQGAGGGAAAAPTAPAAGGAAPDVSAPATPLPATPVSNPTSDKRNECGRTYSGALNRCALDPGTSLVCRNQARETFLACLRG
jgi:type II secretory pathway pseudopilin PulG